MQHSIFSRLLAPFVAGTSLAFISLTLVTSGAFAQTLPEQPVDRIVAVVDEDVVLESEMERAVANIREQLQAQNTPMPPAEVLEKQVLDRLILQKIQVQHAQQTGIRVSETEVDDSLRRMAEQNGLDLPGLRNAILAQGYSFANFRQDMRNELLISELRKRVVDTRVNVTDSEIEIYLASEGADLGSEVHLAQILIGVPQAPSPEQVETARQQIEQVYQQLQAGMDFSEAAVTYSQAANALEGGDLGWRPADSLPPVFAAEITQLQPGEISRPMKGPSGFHIVKMLGQREGGERLVEERKARHIMIKPTELVTENEAKELIESLHDQLLEGADFGDLAREYSDDDVTALRGGDLGWFQPLSYGSAMHQQLNRLSTDEVSEPYRSNIGWHIVQDLGTRQTDDTSAQVRRMAQQRLRERKSEEVVENWLRELRGQAFVEYRLDA